MTAIALAIHFDLFASSDQLKPAAQRLRYLIRKSKFKIATGFVGTAIVCPALTKIGESQLAYRMLLETKCPSWLYPITMGATTMWERWDSMLPDGTINPGEMTSFNHYALGAVASWLHSVVGGISSIEPGWKKIRFEPVPGGTLTNAKVKYLSPYGLVESEWSIQNGTFSLNIAVPPNTTAQVKLPAEQEQKVHHVGSGSHSFSVKYDAPDWPPLAIHHPFGDEEENE
jgi:alpha-L-rhamnosidase